MFLYYHSKILEKPMTEIVRLLKVRGRILTAKLLDEKIDEEGHNVLSKIDSIIARLDEKTKLLIRNSDISREKSTIGMKRSEGFQKTNSNIGLNIKTAKELLETIEKTNANFSTVTV